MHESKSETEKLRSFVAKIATLRKTGGGWIVTGPEPFMGESSRLVIIDDLAEEAQKLLQLQAKDPCTVTEQTMADLLVQPHLK